MTAIAIEPAHFPWFDYSRYSFSLGLKTPAGVYLSGHTASEYDPVAKRIVVRSGMTEQVRTAWAKIGAILEAAGLGFENVTRVVEYLRPEGIERYMEAAAVREEVFGAHRPVVNTVPVKSLLRPEAFIEIEVTAELRSRGTGIFRHCFPSDRSACGRTGSNRRRWRCSGANRGDFPACRPNARRARPRLRSRG